mmetsp:Transcript_12971/g.38611  ORF Transcript_12971/g.38611 Transcript_12971/m.38611 type:complete len:203 (-) Transcript_12971:245-853(-)
MGCRRRAPRLSSSRRVAARRKASSASRLAKRVPTRPQTRCQSMVPSASTLSSSATASTSASMSSMSNSAPATVHVRFCAVMPARSSLAASSAMARSTEYWPARPPPWCSWPGREPFVKAEPRVGFTGTARRAGPLNSRGILAFWGALDMCTHWRSSHARLRLPGPPRFFWSRQKRHVPHSGRLQAAHRPQRPLRCFWPPPGT